MNYYETLEVNKEASEIEIKKAYRKLAHKFHPDKLGGNSDKFKQITEAYDVLSNRSKRDEYDRFGSTDFDFGSVAEAMEQSARAGFVDKREQQLVKISALIEQVVAQAAAQKAQSITSELAKELADRVLNIVYGE